MKLSFIIPVYNHLDLTQECLRTLRETVGQQDYEIALVNDGCDEATTQGLRDLRDDRTTVLENAGNQGFAHSNNVGAMHASGELLFLVNNDLVFQAGWLEPMLEAFSRHKKVGMVGNVQRSVATGEIDHAGTFVSPKGTISHRREENRGFFRVPAYSRSPIVTGACCAIPRDLYLRLGGFDEAFVNGGEDVDLCLRLAKLGYKVLVANRSVVLHHVSATRRDPNANDEWNSRLLQKRWSDQLASLAASSWPDRYLAEARQVPHPRALDAKLLRDALSRFLMLKKGPAPAGLYNAYCEQERNERHWKSILDGWNDEQIKNEERNTHATPLKDRYEFSGLYTDSTSVAGAWIRETATLTIPRGALVSSITLKGQLHEANPIMKEEAGRLGIAIKVNDAAISSKFPVDEGAFSLEFDNIPARAQDNTQIQIKLLGVERSNTYAYLGRKLSSVSIIPRPVRKHLSKFRAQRLNKRFAIHSIHINGEDVFNFAKDGANPLNTEYVLRHAHLGVNIVGWFKAELGIGESARLAAKAAKESGLPYSLVNLKVNCLASQGDQTYADELSDKNPHPVNIFHLDAPQSPDIDHYHGKSFRRDRYNIAYWAWELPDFPDHWTKHFQYFDEVWTPSNFVREAVAMKAPIPVLTVPHCIHFTIPDRDYRQELGLPKDKFLYTFAYDLNSYQERKNPRAAIEAFKAAFCGTDRLNDAALVIKIHSKGNNQESYQELLELLKDVPNYYLIDRTLSREMTYGLMKACDAYISLHRSEGFGLTVAESMYLERPVISTNWSATAEFVTESNGCPVDYKLIPLEKSHGPYKGGQIWADPDPLDAAKHMRRLIDDSDYAAKLGKQAKKDITGLCSPTRVADLYRRRLRSIALW
ncbi:glycosyltransferase [Pelagicoccus sp. SDUM812003]|uniref:glycosyltransferase n=1 Tax=Pelagicoccus sp. SDUM812003 TaxID=3041267 RepID=UPI00280D7113|nr:glycosyltransferase [Pelagicoccus sp. SDUM812003]MDQ8202514.1 glycosyltransferase [Pelagicoccus sp. SDUM812003]